MSADDDLQRLRERIELLERARFGGAWKLLVVAVALVQIPIIYHTGIIGPGKLKWTIGILAMVGAAIALLHVTTRTPKK